MSFTKEDLNKFIKQLDKANEESFKRAKKEEKERQKYNQEFFRLQKEYTKEKGSIVIKGEKFLTFKEHEEWIKTIYGDHCYQTPDTFNGFFSGSVLREISILVYKTYIEHNYKDYIKQFEV